MQKITWILAWVLGWYAAACPCKLWARLPADTSLQYRLPFPAGASVNSALLKNRLAYQAVVLREYNSLTPENAMKMPWIHPAQDRFYWADADYLVEYAAAHHKRVHGHTLLWHNAIPGWVHRFHGDAAAWEALVKQHIQTVVQHFRGKVHSWDVVNEAIADDGTLRNSLWLQQLGPDYIARCFRYAHEADPDALLFYNDYGHEWGPKKRDAILQLVARLQQRGIPIHGIGLQMHTRYNLAPGNLFAAIRMAAATGLLVHVSELDVSVNPAKAPHLVFTPQLARQQAQQYAMVVKAYRSIPARQQYGITTWNVGDADSWLPGWNKCPEWPLPFDSAYRRKPAYAAMIEAAAD